MTAVGNDDRLSPGLKGVYKTNVQMQQSRATVHQFLVWSLLLEICLDSHVEGADQGPHPYPFDWRRMSDGANTAKKQKKSVTAGWMPRLQELGIQS
jgi:hypothetical protein